MAVATSIAGSATAGSPDQAVDDEELTPKSTWKAAAAVKAADGIMEQKVMHGSGQWLVHGLTSVLLVPVPVRRKRQSAKAVSR